MNFQDTIMFVDELIFVKTGKHLDDLQIGLIEGVLHRKKYVEIAKAMNCSEGYIKDVAYELWERLSEILGEDINKSNLRSSLLRKGIANYGNLSIVGDVGDGNVIGSLPIYSPGSESPEFLRGKQQAKLEMIANFKKAGLSNEQIATYLDLNIHEIEGTE